MHETQPKAHGSKPSDHGSEFPDIFQFTTHIDYLTAIESFRRFRGGRRVTLDKWAERLGFRSPRSVAMIMKGQRIPSLKMITALGRDLKLSRHEQRYLELLVEAARARKAGMPTDQIEAEMSRLNPRDKQRFLVDVRTFSYIADWYHVVIKQLIAAPGFVEDLTWIQKRLRRKISPAKIRESLETLISLGMIERSESGGELRVAKESVHTPLDIPSVAVRNHHRGMLDRAKEALEEQSVTAREFATATFRTDPTSVPEIKQRIRDFLDGIEQEFSDSESVDVYQLNLQLFEHTTTVREPSQRMLDS